MKTRSQSSRYLEAVDVKPLAREIVLAASMGEPESVIIEFGLATEAQNQLLFFFKPEVFLVGSEQQATTIVDLSLSALERFEAEIAGCMLISGARLAETETIDRHYGFINLMSRRASSALSAKERSSVADALGVNNTVPILGGHEFLATYPDFDHERLEQFWRTKQSTKLRSGLYAQAYEVHGDPVVLVNGFHPTQLAHYTSEGRVIALLLVNSDMPWGFLRERLVGDTFPDRALPGSIRRTLHEKGRELGLGQVGIENNCVHLSAGPFEALFELQNFMASTSAVKFDLDRTNVARLIRELGPERDLIAAALGNPSMTLPEGELTLFDATESLDTRSSIHLFRVAFHRA